MMIVFVQSSYDNSTVCYRYVQGIQYFQRKPNAYVGGIALKI